MALINKNIIMSLSNKTVPIMHQFFIVDNKHCHQVSQKASNSKTLIYI